MGQLVPRIMYVGRYLLRKTIGVCSTLSHEVVEHTRRQPSGAVPGKAGKAALDFSRNVSIGLCFLLMYLLTYLLTE